MRLSLTYWPSLREPHGRRVTTTWPKLLARLSVPRVVADKHDAPGLSLATFTGDRRGLANVERVYAVGLDLDKQVPHWALLHSRFAAVESFVHTTWANTDEAPRARVFLLLSRPVTGDEYRRVYEACAAIAEIGGLVVDRAASDPSRFWFLPSVRPGGEFLSAVGSGPAIDVEAALAAVPPPRAPSVPPRPLTSTPASADVEARAAAYLARCEPAVSGSGGHTRTFYVAQKLVRGFGLDEETAYRLLASWNATCQPPWSERELRRKVRQAAERGQTAEGELRDRPRRAS